MNDEKALTLDQLSRRVAERLENVGLRAQGDGRVTAVPDARTIRYYGTLGLVDRPSIVEREARYGLRHVLQIVAIKALQSAGLPLGRVQERLYGRSNSELEALIGSLGESTQRDRPPAVRSVLWREVPIEPGVKLLVEAGWSPRTSAAALEERIRTALDALSGKEEGANS